MAESTEITNLCTVICRMNLCLLAKRSHLFTILQPKAQPYPFLSRGAPTLVRRRPLHLKTLSSHTIEQLPGSCQSSTPTPPHRPFIPLLAACTDSTSLRKVHGLLLVHGLARSTEALTKLVGSYGSLDEINSARLVFDGIPDPDYYSWKLMLRLYVMSERHEDAVAFYREMRRHVLEEDNVVFSLALKSCIKLLDFEEGKKLHCRMVKLGDPDCFLLNSLIGMYAKNGDIECARAIFDKIQSRNVVSWTSVICGYVKSGCGEEGLVMFNEMTRIGTKPNEYTMGGILTACSMLFALHQGKWIHGSIIKAGFGLNSFLGTALLDMYVKCGDLTDSRRIFDDLLDVDLVSWTAMIVGYTQQGHPAEALHLFSDKQWACITPNSVSIASVLSASAQLQHLNLGRSIHALSVKLLVDESVVVMNTLIVMYAKCRATLEATCIFETVEQKDVITWNSIIAGYSQNNLGYEALCLFNQMRSYGCSPDAISVVSALSACACLASLPIGSSFHVYAVKHALLSNVYVKTALINLYNKCGDVGSAHRVFDEMSVRNVVTWCAMIGGYGIQGNSSGSFRLFSEMLKEEMEPNEVTFLSILSTCSHTGMVSEGKKYFDSMSQSNGIAPSMKHYACMVDLLARAGELEEALEFIEKMPVPADAGVWGAFLHGCKLHSRLDLGERAARKMIELHPETSDYYVLMSNLYTSCGKWAESISVRALMKKRGLVKLPGCSSVPLDKG